MVLTEKTHLGIMVTTVGRRRRMRRTKKVKTMYALEPLNASTCARSDHAL